MMRYGCRWGRTVARWRRLLPATLVPLSLLGCRLYDPPRYARLSFAPGQRSTRVLMIGNSLTYYNDLPGLLQQFSASEAAPIYIEKITTPLASLKFHWDMGVAPTRIREGHWDYVVLQEFSRMPVTDREESERYFGLFNEEVRKSGARTIIFENWIHRGLDRDYATLLDAYHAIQNRTGGALAPIGAAWRQCENARPDIDLLIDDRHPTDGGTYLAAAVLYDAIYHKKSGDLPMTLQGPRLPAEEKQTLRQFADQAANDTSAQHSP